MTRELPSGDSKILSRAEQSALMRAAVARDPGGRPRGWVQRFDSPGSYAPVDDDGAVDDPIALPLADIPALDPASGPVIDVEVIDVEPTQVRDIEQHT